MPRRWPCGAVESDFFGGSELTTQHLRAGERAHGTGLRAGRARTHAVADGAGPATAAPPAARPAARFRVRAYRAGDEGSIVRSWNAVFAGGDPLQRPSLATWRWLYEDAPFEPAVHVAEDQRGAILAHCAPVPIAMQCEGEVVRAAQDFDVLTHPDAGRTLCGDEPFLATARAAIAHADARSDCYCTYGFAPAAALRAVGRALGYQPLLEPVPALRHRLVDDGACGGAGGPAMAPGLRCPSTMTLDESDPWAHEIDALWQRVQPRHAFTVVRDARWFQWRYVHAPMHYRRFVLRDGGGALRALFVTRAWWACTPTLAIVDWLAAPDDDEALGVCLRHAVELARESALARVEMWLPEHALAFRAALQLGFERALAGLHLGIRLHRRARSLRWHGDWWSYAIGDSGIS